MASASGSRLGDSWIVNETEESNGNISWAEDSEPSDVDSISHVKKLHTPPRPRRTTPKRTPQRAPQRVASSSVVEPEFIMPAIREQPGPLRSSVSKHTLQKATPNREKRLSSRTISPHPISSSRKPGPTTADKAVDAALGTASYFLDILVTTLKTLKRPISWVLAAYLFAGLLVLVQNLLTSSITSALTPICRVPGVSLLHLPFCSSPYTTPDHSHTSIPTIGSANPEFDALMTVQGKFETVLEDSAAGISLPLDMKRSETSIRDLRQVVRFSTIPSKNELLHEFDGFIETARIASYDLQKFNSHVGRAVDSVLSTARWTQRVLDDIAVTTSQSSGLIGDFINNRLLAPFQPLKFTESRLLDQYIKHTRLISDEIETLISEAQALLLVLTNLEDRLDIIHAVSLRDNLATKSSRDEILSQLWTYLGGNRAKLGKVDNQLRLLTRVGEYRKLAYAHVSGTILKLQAMGAELEELRTRVGGAALADDRGLQSVPLQVHLENIRLGVERLEGVREKNREIERGYTRGVIERSNGEEKMLLVEG